MKEFHLTAAGGGEAQSFLFWGGQSWSGVTPLRRDGRGVTSTGTASSRLSGGRKVGQAARAAEHGRVLRQIESPAGGCRRDGATRSCLQRYAPPLGEPWNIFIIRERPRPSRAERNGAYGAHGDLR